MRSADCGSDPATKLLRELLSKHISTSPKEVADSVTGDVHVLFEPLQRRLGSINSTHASKISVGDEPRCFSYITAP